MINKLDEINYNMLKQSINTADIRQKVIAQNLANINTKGYKAWKVVFDDQVNKNQNGSLQLTKTDDRHYTNAANSDGTSDYTIEKDDTTSMRTDGNNVDVDNEMSNLAANTILYYTLISQINNRMEMRRTVLK